MKKINRTTLHTIVYTISNFVKVFIILLGMFLAFAIHSIFIAMLIGGFGYWLLSTIDVLTEIYHDKLIDKYL